MPKLDRASVAIFLCLSSHAWAQTTLGSAALGGTVRDPTGGVVPAANVEVTDVDHGVKRDTKSNETGAFLFPTLQPGRYTLRVSKEAFEAAEIQDIALAR